MHYFRTEKNLYDVLEKLFTQLQMQPELLESFVHSNLVVRIRFLNPAAELLLDGRQPPLGIFYGERPGEANFEMTIEADRLHRIWSGNEELTAALFGGHIATKGNIMKVHPFIELMQNCRQIYPSIG